MLFYGKNPMQETKSILAGLLSSIAESAKGRCVNRQNHSGPKAQNIRQKAGQNPLAIRAPKGR
jgi:hypothetical protein